MIKKLLLFSLIASTSVTFAQDANIFEPDSIKKKIEALQIRSSLRIDGIMNDAEWRKVKPTSGFTQIEPFQGKKPTQDTEVKVLYNKQYLYFGIFAKDSLGKKAIRATDFKRDFSFRQHDMVALSFDGL